MADASDIFAITVPAGNGVGNKHTTQMQLGPSNVERIIIVFPDGCAGLVGIAIQSGGSNVYPTTDGTWYAFNNYPYELLVTNQADSGDWAALYYNLDYFPHTITVIVEYNYLTASAALSSALPVSV